MKAIKTLTALTVILATAILGGIAGVESNTELSSVGVQVRETSLGDLVADAAREETGMPVSLIPAGSLKEITIPKGKVKPEDVIKSLQYPDDKLAVIEITGKQLTSALERSVSIYPQKNMGFLQVSGIEFTFDPKSPKGSRVLTVVVDGKQVVDDREYRVTTTQPLAKGAYGYFTIWGKELKPVPVDETYADVVTKFLSKHDSLNYQNQNRILPKKNK